MPNEARRRPPYVPYRVFKGAIANLDHRPAKVTASLYANMSGTTRQWLFSAMRYFKLIDESDAPSSRLLAMSTKDEVVWKKNMAVLIREGYSPDALAILEGGTYGNLRAYFGAASTTRAVCRFLIDAAVDSGLPVSREIVSADAGGRDAWRGPPRADENNLEVIEFPLPIPGKPGGRIIVPRDLAEPDLPMFSAMVAAVVAYAKHNLNRR